MNLIPKTKQWMMLTTRVMRMSNAGSRGPTGSGGPYEDLEQRPVDPNKTIDYSQGDAPTAETSKTFSPITEAPAVGVPTAEPLYMMSHKHARGRVNKDVIEHLKNYFDDQIMYYKTMANYHKSAMKRVKKIKKNWTKLLD